MLSRKPRNAPDTPYWSDRLLRTKMDYNAATAAGEALDHEGASVERSFVHGGRTVRVAVIVTTAEN